MKYLFFIYCFLFLYSPSLWAENKKDAVEGVEMGSVIFDDEALLGGYAEKYGDEDRDVLLAMIADDSLGSYKSAAAIRIFRQNFADQVLSKEKPLIIKNLFRRLNRTDSAFVQVEIMHTLVALDRYQYFATMTTALIQKMDHYNRVVSTNAFNALSTITKGSLRAREARIVFNTLRKVLFLSRKRLENVDEPDDQLKQKISLLRWSIKMLGTQELKRLPAQVIRLL